MKGVICFGPRLAAIISISCFEALVHPALRAKPFSTAQGLTYSRQVFRRMYPLRWNAQFPRSDIGDRCPLCHRNCGFVSGPFQGANSGQLICKNAPGTKERARLEDELHRVTAALTAFGKVYMQGSKLKAGVASRKKRAILEDERELPPRRGHAGQSSGQPRNKPRFYGFDCCRKADTLGSSLQMHVIF